MRERERKREEVEGVREEKEQNREKRRAGKFTCGVYFYLERQVCLVPPLQSDATSGIPATNKWNCSVSNLFPLLSLRLPLFSLCLLSFLSFYLILKIVQIRLVLFPTIFPRIFQVLINRRKNGQ